MSYRFMRIIVFFDLPTLTLEDRKEYRKFRKKLIKTGFIMMQESVYCKLLLNQSGLEGLIKNLREDKPNKGLVQILTVTEKQYSKMEFLVGEGNSEYLSTDSRLVIL